MNKISERTSILQPNEIIISKYCNDQLINLIFKSNRALSPIGNMTESIIGLAFAILYRDDKKILDIPISDHIPQIGTSKIKIRHVLSMTTTIPVDDFNENVFYKMNNIVYWAAQRNRSGTPGREWEYNHFLINLLPAVFKKIKNKSIDKFLDEIVFKPNNIKYKWKKDPSGNLYSNGFSTNSIGLINICKYIINNSLHKELMKPSKNKLFGWFCWWIDVDRKFIWTSYNEKWLIIIPRKKIVIYYKGNSDVGKIIKFINTMV